MIQEERFSNVIHLNKYKITRLCLFPNASSSYTFTSPVYLAFLCVYVFVFIFFCFQTGKRRHSAHDEEPGKLIEYTLFTQWRTFFKSREHKVRAFYESTNYLTQRLLLYFCLFRDLYLFKD